MTGEFPAQMASNTEKKFPFDDVIMPPGWLHTLETGGHTEQRYWLFMWIKIICIRDILWRILTTEPIFYIEDIPPKIVSKMC